MKKRVMRQGVICMMALAGLIVSGCSVAGLFVKDYDFAAKESWEIKTPQPHILEAIADTGRSMDFDIDYAAPGGPLPLVAGNDGRFRAVLFSRNHLTGLKATFLGLRSTSGLTLYAWQGGAYMEVYAMVDGNLGSGTQKAATKLMSDFRKKLSEKVGEIVVIEGAAAGGPPTAAVRPVAMVAER
jgi:hypothetical protein